MKRLRFPLLFLLSGFALGLLCSVSLMHFFRPAAGIPDVSVSQDTIPSTTQLLQSAAQAAQALHDKDYEALSKMVHPDRGVTFTPYSTVDPKTDLTLTAQQIRELEQDTTRYTWGYEDGRGDPIQMTIPQYLERYVFDADYTQAPVVGVDEIQISGNALENLPQAYPDCRFVDLCYPSRDPESDGLDWCSLKLVFSPGPSQWQLVGVVHGEWTI